MGCCVSSNKTTTLRKSQDPPKPLISRYKPSESNATIEEETVKEVLSVTPKWNPTTFAKSKPRQNKFFKEEQRQVSEKKPLSIYIAEDTSEVRSFSETTPMATSTAEEREETRKRVERSQAKLLKNRSFPGERTVHGAREVGSVRFVQCRDQTAQKMGNGGARRSRDPAENTSRRLRSPATGSGAGEVRSVVGRSLSVRKTSRCPARVRTGTTENGYRKMKNPATERKWASAERRNVPWLKVQFQPKSAAKWFYGGQLKQFLQSFRDSSVSASTEIQKGHGF
ncbi:hypothetical protein Fmac_005271 [Flemingia macrophylla]|uniref:Uncharacterized protein n=1 Tax=Flemingia macrophylla TaxID=520843 RepID=A0ABD1N7B1_9FABA